MYLGNSYQDVVDNLKPLFPPKQGDSIIACARKRLWLLSLKGARYIKHHVARLTPKELTEGLTINKWRTIAERIDELHRKGVL